VALLFSAAFALPLALGVWYRADPLTIANESLAYRFLFSERLLNGEGSSVWVLAGFLTTAIQTSLLKLINMFSGLPLGDLKDRTHWFSLLFTGGVVAAGIAVFLAASFQRSLRLVDLILLGIIGLGPLYLTRTIGFYYYSLPDYYHLNVLLALVAVWLFQLAWHDRGTTTVDTHLPLKIFLAGLFTGFVCANKVTMAIIAVPLLIALLIRDNQKPVRVLCDALLAFAAAILGFLFVIWWFYLFKSSAVRGMFAAWIATIRNPGGESSFWSSDFRNYLTSYSYGYVIAFYLISLAAAGFIAIRSPRRSYLTFALLGALLLGGVAWTYFVIKRPAGTTFFEGAVALLGLSCIALTIVSRLRLGGLLIWILTIAWTCYATGTFQLRSSVATLVASRPWADDMWRMHSELLQFSKGHEIIVIHPNNSYGYGGVEEFLLKGTADVPTWYFFSGHGQPILARYAPGMSFRHEYGGPAPNSFYPENAVVFWVDRPEFPALIERYSLLKTAYLRPDVIHKDWTMTIQGGSAVIKAHAILLPPPAAAPGGMRH
jgi:hypothetical protein